MAKKNIHPFMKAVGAKTEDEFYSRFPTEESYQNHMQFGGAAIIPDNNPWGTGTKFVPTQYKRTTNGMMQFGGGYLDYTSLDPTVAGMQNGGSFDRPGYFWTNNGWRKSTGSTNNGASFSRFGGSQNVTNGLPAPLEYAYLQDGGSIPNEYQTGGITDQDRAQWNKQQGAAYRQGYQGDNHNRTSGQQFMQSQGTDPNKLAAYQQDLQNQSKITPWGNQPAARAGSAGFSGADNFYGNKTAGEHYTEYQVQHNNEAPKSFGTNYTAATAYNNSLSKPQTDEYQGFGDPTKDVNYNPSGQSGFGHTSMAPGTPVAQPQSPPVAMEQSANSHTNENTDYSIDSARQDEGLAKYGGIHIKPENKGKFNATKQRTGKSTEELTHSSDPVTRKRAIFAQNAAKWHHKEYGGAIRSNSKLSKFIKAYKEGGAVDLTTPPVNGDPNAYKPSTDPDIAGPNPTVPDAGPEPEQGGYEAAQGPATSEGDITQPDQSQQSLKEPLFGKRSGAAFTNALGAGMQAASYFLDRKNQREMQGYNRQLGQTDQAFAAQKMNTAGSKGSYNQQGVLMPNANTPVAPGITYAQQKFGGYQSGGIYELPEEHISQLRKQGYTIEYV